MTGGTPPFPLPGRTYRPAEGAQTEGSLCYAFTPSTNLHRSRKKQLVAWTHALGSIGAGKYTVDDPLSMEPVGPDYAKQKETLYSL